jgi:hypothetical protein
MHVKTFFMIQKLITLRFIIWSALLIQAVNVLGTFAPWFPRLVWLDEVLHFIAGAWVALLWWHMLGRRSFDMIKESVQHKAVFILLTLSFVALIGVLWEFFEFGLDAVVMARYGFPLNQPSIGDTLSDLLLDILGGLSLALLISPRQLRK